MFDKKAVRQKMRAQRKGLSFDAVREASLKVATHLSQFPPFIVAKRVAIYCSQENEIDVLWILHEAVALKKEIYVPVFSSKKTGCLNFYAVNENTPFTKNAFGIDEPLVETTNAIESHQLDLVLVPLVAFDEARHRLGRGAGCYDKSFAFKRDGVGGPILVGVGYDFQKVQNTYPESWDVGMDYVVTEKGLL